MSLHDIQKVPSVKLYSKIITAGLNSVDFSIVCALSKTLGPELEFLSSMGVTERFEYLQSLKYRLANEKLSGSLISKSKMFFDKFELLKYRRALSLLVNG